MKKRIHFEAIIGVIVSIIMVGIIFVGIDSAEKTVSEEDISRLSESINLAAVNCYSIEGSFPDSLEYLANNYGIIIDNDKYNVFYEVQASNISPIVRVTRKE